MTVVRTGLAALGVAAPVAAVLVGAYLLAWAERWPHADVRDRGALLAGGFTLVVGLATVLVMVRSRSRWMRRIAILGAVPVAVAGFLLVGVVTTDQRQACGDLLPACQSLLPGP